MLSRYFYLAASVATAATAPNALVLAGGFGLACSALSTFLPDRVKDKFRFISCAAAGANIPLIANGVLLGMSGFMASDAGSAIAGSLLAAANLNYLKANISSLNGCSALDHAKASVASGLMIATSGGAMADVPLALIGGAFAIDGALRIFEARVQSPAPS